MVISEFEWDDANVAHIERHQLTPDEVEGIFLSEYKIRRAREKRYIALRETLDGRPSLIVFLRQSKGRVRVTARDMTNAERRLWRRK